MGGVFHETFVNVYMLKDSNLLCCKEELLKQPDLHVFTYSLFVK